MTFKPGTALEFFAGIGLARMGLEQAGWTVLWSNDIDPKKQEMYVGHWGGDDIYECKSIFDVDADSLPSAELAWASFPCVDLSLAGARAGLRGRHSSAYWGFQRVLEELGSRRPPMVVIENVPGLLTTHGGQDMLAIVTALASLGYQLDIIEIDAVHFVPQSRPRLFVVGASFPYRLSENQGHPVLRSKQAAKFISQHPEIPWGHVPVNARLPARRSDLHNFLETFPPDADIWWSKARVESLLGRMSPRHRAMVERLARAGAITYATVYRRVRPSGYMAEVRSDGVAGCLRTPRGGSSRQFVLELGRGEIRARNMTAIEYGRLQGAEAFKIKVPESQALFGFGDAVCVPVVKWLVQHCLHPIKQKSMRTDIQLELMHA